MENWIYKRKKYESRRERKAGKDTPPAFGHLLFQSACATRKKHREDKYGTIPSLAFP
jgi:hypothetical protein